MRRCRSAAAPIAAARPFDLAGGDPLDQRRALLCLTQAVYYEAGFEPLDGRRAVAQVVLNRMRHPAFPKSVCGVVYQRTRPPVCQFSFVCDGSLYRAPGAGRVAAGARRSPRAALAGYVERSVGAATHYHADYVAPRWAPMLAKVAKLGAHIFYRWPGAWGLPAAFTGRYIGEPRDPLSLRPPLRQAVLTDGDRRRRSSESGRRRPADRARAERRRRPARHVARAGRSTSRCRPRPAPRRSAIAEQQAAPHRRAAE